MTDLAEHLGELMGQSPAEKAADDAWVEAAELAMGEAAPGDAGAVPADVLGDNLVAPAGDTASAMVDTQIPPDSDIAALDPASAADAAGGTVAGFPFEVSELISLLPHSVAGRAGEMWTFASQMSGESNTFLVALGALALGFVVITLASTVRVWRREEEFAVSGFGDTLTAPGSRYTVKQDLPSGAPGLSTAVRGPAGARPAAAEPTFKAPLAPAAKAEVAPAPAAVAAKGPKTVRRQLTPKFGATPLVSAPAPVKSEPAATEDKTESKDDRPRRGRRFPGIRSTPRARDAGAAIAPAAPSAPLAASFHGCFGSYHETDRVFADDYLKQTIEAFEAAYLKGRGPRLTGKLRVGDNVRAERLFMVATRAASETPSAALAALWQAVEENPDDGVAWLRLAHYYMEMGDTQNARKILEPLLVKAEADGASLIASAAANSLGRLIALDGDIDRAHNLFSRGLDHAEKSGKPYMIAVAASNLGVLEAARGNNDAARGLLLRGIKSFDDCRETIASARTKVVLGAVYKAMGDQADADRVWGEAHATFKSEGLEEEAAIVARWIAGEDPPTGVGL